MESGRSLLILTEINIQESGISALHENLLTWSIQGFVHEIHSISHQGTQPLRIFLGEEWYTLYLQNKAHTTS